MFLPRHMPTRVTSMCIHFPYMPFVHILPFFLPPIGSLSLPLSPSLTAPTLGLALWLWESQISAPSGCRRYHQMPLLTPYLSLMHFPDVCQAAMHTYDIPTPHSQQYNSFVKTLNN